MVTNLLQKFIGNQRKHCGFPIGDEQHEGLLYRAENFCDLDEAKLKEKTLITNAFIACDYPVPAVDRIIKNYRPKTEEEKIEQKEEDANSIKYIFHMFQKYQIFCGSNWKKKMWKLFSPEEERLVLLFVTTNQKFLVKDGRTKFTKYEKIHI